MRGDSGTSDDISIHAPPRGATAGKSGILSSPTISIHAPPRGATEKQQNSHFDILFQFTPLREGRRGTRRTSPGTADISIHAPPRGATATFARRWTWRVFQFTPLREGRPHRLGFHAVQHTISIHAPPRGATPIFQRQVRKRGYFNSRPSARGDARDIIDTLTAR